MYCTISVSLMRIQVSGLLANRNGAPFAINNLRKSLLNSSHVSTFRLCVFQAHLSGGALEVTSWFGDDVGGMFCLLSSSQLMSSYLFKQVCAELVRFQHQTVFNMSLQMFWLATDSCDLFKPYNFWSVSTWKAECDITDQHALAHHASHRVLPQHCCHC